MLRGPNAEMMAASCLAVGSSRASCSPLWARCSCAAAPALADDPVLNAASYPDATTYNCHTDPITIYPGQNLNLYGATKTCPNAERVSGPGDPGVFAAGSTAEGYVTRFKPSMVEVHPDGSLTTPSVWDLHLHHVVWLGPGRSGYGTGEEKTEWKLPQGYGFKVRGRRRPGASTT